MRKAIWVTAGIMSLSAAGFILGVVGRADQHQESAQKGKQVTVQESFQGKSPRGEMRHTASTDPALTKMLLQKVDALEHRVDDLLGQQESSDERPEATAEERPSLTLAQIMERNRSRIQRINAALDSEPRNGQWSRDTSIELQSLFSSVVPPSSSLTETTCGETFCRMTVLHDNEKAREQFEVFPRKIRGMGVHGLIEEAEDGKSRTTLYVVRKENDSPDHPVRKRDQG